MRAPHLQPGLRGVLTQAIARAPPTPRRKGSLSMHGIQIPRPCVNLKLPADDWRRPSSDWHRSP